MYVITGATGNIGKRIALELLKNNKEVKVIGRSADKLEELVQLGATAVVGDVEDAAFVKSAFADARAVFAMIPPKYNTNDFRGDQQKIARNYVDALQGSSVEHVVLLSSVGAHLPSGAGVVQGLADAEGYFKELININVLNLRPSYFMENVLGQIQTIKHMGIAGSPVNGDLKFPLVATKDIAAKAAEYLQSLTFTGNSVAYVLGPKEYSYNELTAIVGKAIGKPDLAYFTFPYEDAVQGMIASGWFSENGARLMVELTKAMNDGILLNDHVRDANNTTPTTFEEFVEVFVYLYNQ